MKTRLEIFSKLKAIILDSIKKEFGSYPVSVYVKNSVFSVKIYDLSEIEDEQPTTREALSIIVLRKNRSKISSLFDNIEHLAEEIGFTLIPRTPTFELDDDGTISLFFEVILYGESIMDHWIDLSGKEGEDIIILEYKGMKEKFLNYEDAIEKIKRKIA